MPLLQRHQAMVSDDSNSPNMIQLQQELADSSGYLSTPKSTSSSSSGIRSRLSSRGKIRPRALYRENNDTSSISSVSSCDFSSMNSEANKNSPTAAQRRKQYMQQKFKERRQIRDESKLKQLLNDMIVLNVRQ